MQKCDYCGTEAGDGAAVCSGCGTPFVVFAEAQPATVCPAPNDVLQDPALECEASSSERQLRIFEVVLVCLLAVGGSILSSVFYFLGARSTGADPTLRWTHSLLHDTACLGLLGYVLARRSKSFSDLGLTWRTIDLPWSIILFFAASFAFSSIYAILKGAGAASVGLRAATLHVAHHLFAPGVSVPTLLVQFINPLFEEMIVRGYVMTEVRELTGSAGKAVLLSTILQASYHLYQGGPMAVSQCGVFLVFSIYYARTTRLTPVVLAHLYMDVQATLWYMLSRAA